ncbi:MAG: ATP-dependent Clp protease adapter ClpS [Spirochaetaceae bacterium]
MIPGSIEQTKEKSKEKVKEPEMYRVVLHNDDYTTMEFVVEVIMKVFKKPVMEATQIMMQVHKSGKGSVGVYTHDIAATKVQQVHDLARQRDFPLKCTMEKA